MVSAIAWESLALRGPKEIKLSHDQQRVQVWLDFFFPGMAQFLKPGEMQVFQGPKVNRSYNITTRTVQVALCLANYL